MAVSYTFEVRWNGVDWTDETIWLLDFHTAIGLPADNYFASIAAPGRAQFIIDNRTRRFVISGAGEVGPFLRPGVQVRLVLNEGLGFTLFYGFIDKYTTAGQQYGSRRVVFECFDLVEPMRWQKASVVYAASKSVATAVSELAAQVYGVPPGTDYDDNGDTIANYGKRGIDADRTSSYEALEAVARSFFGYFGVLRDGTLAYRARGLYDNPGNFTGADIIDQSRLEPGEDSFANEISYERVVNHVKVRCYPPETISSTTVIWKTTAIPAVQPGTTRVFSLPFRDPNTGSLCGASTVITPVNGTDVIINSRSDGAGVVLTGSSSITISYTVQARRVLMSVTNNTLYTAYFITLQVRGNPIVTYDPVTMEIDNSSGQLRRLLDIDAPFLGDAERAYQYCNYVISRYQARQFVKYVDLPGGINGEVEEYEQFELFTYCRVTETQSGLSFARHYIRRIEYWPNKMRLWLDLVSTKNVFTLDVSELDSIDGLGF
jgi:hypothetical protein